MRVAVVAEFYPRRHDPVLGVWAHRQALATRQAGAQLEVFVLHRIIPPAASLRTGRAAGELLRLAAHPRTMQLDGLDVHYVHYVSPPRERAYGRWGRWVAPALGRALRRAGPFDLVHAHNAIPAGDAALRTGLPLVVSVHGGDVLWTAERFTGAVERVLSAARLVLVNSTGIGARARALGAARTKVVHLGASAVPGPRSQRPLLVSLGHLVARKRHADVLWALREVPDVDYLIIGDGPERPSLERLAAELGVAERVELAGQLDPDAALGRLSEGGLFVMPSVDEAFGVAYVEALAAGLPAIAAEGEPGPAEIAAAGEGIVLVPPRDPQALAKTIAGLLGDSAGLGEAAKRTAASFTWEECGIATVAAYEEALR
jgi:glycosyltransferase involved in cell wall biosynthesis